ARRPPARAVVAGYLAQPDAPFAWLAARRLGAPLVVDLMISLWDTLAGDRGTARGPAARVLRAADRLAVRAADLVLADTAANAEFIVRRLGAREDRVAVVPVGAEPALFPPSPMPDGPVRAVFYGKLSPMHGLDTILDAARRPGVPPVRLIGDGQLGAWLDAEIARDPPPGVERVPWVPYAGLGAEIAGSAICLGVFGRSEKASRVVPNKVWQGMAAGRAVVTADCPAVREVLTDGVDALLVPPGDPAALAAALTRLARDPDLRARLGAAAHRRFLATGHPRAVAGRLLAALAARFPSTFAA
ncbi:MAG: glycosyltransferase, partial [Actinomycetota bacterium]